MIYLFHYWPAADFCAIKEMNHCFVHSDGKYISLWYYIYIKLDTFSWNKILINHIFFITIVKYNSKLIYYLICLLFSYCVMILISLNFSEMHKNLLIAQTEKFFSYDEKAQGKCRNYEERLKETAGRI